MRLKQEVDVGAELNALAGGRVWTGSQALDLGLVDKLGGLNFAINEAVELAKLGDTDYSLIEVPSVPTPQELLEQTFGMGAPTKNLGLQDIVQLESEALNQLVESMDRLLNSQGIQARAPITGLK